MESLLWLAPEVKGLVWDTPLTNYHILSVDETIEVDGMMITGIRATQGPLTVKIGPFKKTEYPEKNPRIGWASIGFKITYKEKTIVNLGDSLLKAEES